MLSQPSLPPPLHPSLPTPSQPSFPVPPHLYSPSWGPQYASSQEFGPLIQGLTKTIQALAERIDKLESQESSSLGASQGTYIIFLFYNYDNKFTLILLFYQIRSLPPWRATLHHTGPVWHHQVLGFHPEVDLYTSETVNDGVQWRCTQWQVRCWQEGSKAPAHW